MELDSITVNGLRYDCGSGISADVKKFDSSAGVVLPNSTGMRGWSAFATEPGTDGRRPVLAGRPETEFLPDPVDRRQTRRLFGEHPRTGRTASSAH
jgi:hypothetical protein